MNFSQFLQTLYNNSNSKSQPAFLGDLLNATYGKIVHDEDYLKRIVNGGRPLTDNFRLCYEKFDIDKCIIQFKNVINSKRLCDILDSFGVPDDVKKDLDILVEAVSLQFVNYMKYGEKDITTDIGEIYQTLVDQYGNGAIKEANEIALFHAINYYVQAVNAIASIGSNNDLLELQRPFENFFDSIYKIFKVYNTKCNREGHELLKAVKARVLNGDFSSVDLYLDKIAEPGSNPIELEKELKYTIYDNYKFKDQVLTETIKLDDESERDKIINAFKTLKFYPVNEIFFTERITFHETGDKEDLLEKVEIILYRIDNILGTIKATLNTDYKPLEKVLKALSDAHQKYQLNNIIYTTDGTYFPETGEIQYAPTIETFTGNYDGSLERTGDVKLEIEKDPILSHIKNNDFNSWTKILCHFLGQIWQRGGFGDLMAEMYTFNGDNTYRLYMFPVTCKARTYRFVRDIKKTVLDDDMTGFIYIAILSMYYQDSDEELEKIANMKSDERMGKGKDLLVAFGFNNKSIYCYALTKEDVIANNPPMSFKVGLNFLTPLIEMIMFNQYWKEHKDEIMKEYENKKKESSQPK